MGAVAGYLIGRGSAESAAATVTTTASEGHSGAGLPAYEFGDLPAMLAHFKEEGLPVPTFQDDQMADLVAYLHSARARPVRKRAGGSSSDLRKFFAGASRGPARIGSKGGQMNARIPLLGLLAIQILIGYEWFISGLTKVVRGGFPSGLADELTEKSEGGASWYASFLDSVVIPNASTFGVLIILGELAVGAALVVAASLWAFRWEALGSRGRGVVLAATVASALGGVVMNVAFHLANGSAHPWLIPGDGFDEGVDLDSLMPVIQLVLAAVSAGTWLALRRERTALRFATRRGASGAMSQGG